MAGARSSTPDDWKRARGLAGRVGGGVDFECSYRIQRQDGAIRHLQEGARLRGAKRPNGRLCRCVAQDVTGQMSAQEQLR
jgi:hypothetical protein